MCHCEEGFSPTKQSANNWQTISLYHDLGDYFVVAARLLAMTN